MAIRQKTVEYPIGIRTTTLAAATRHDFSAVTLYIPETTDRTFRSVYVELTVHDAQSATSSRANLSSWLLGARLGAAAFSDTTVTTTVTDSGEQTAFRFYGPEWAAYFNTNFGTGTSQTFELGVQFGTSSATNPVIWQNISTKLVITYDYDDAAAAKVKTIRIPLESNTGGLTTTLASIGSNQIPALDTYLTEASKTYRAIWFEVDGNESNTATTSYNFAVALDSEGEVQFGQVIQACNSSRDLAFIWVRNDLDTSSAHDFKARVSVTGRTYANLSVTLCVTYEYNEASTTTVTNQVLLPFSATCYLWASADTEAHRFAWDLWLGEPGTLTLMQSAVVMRYSMATVGNPSVKVGGQTARTYTAALGSLACGEYSLQHRFDSGGAAGSGLTVNSAGTKTQLVVDLYASATRRIAPAGYVVLTWASDKSPSGTGAHLSTRKKLLLPSSAIASSTGEQAFAVSCADLPETAPFVVAVGFVSTFICTMTALASSYVEGEIGSGEGFGDGWCTVIATANASGAEVATQTAIGGCSDSSGLAAWRRYPDDIAPCRLDLEASRDWKAYGSTGRSISLECWYSYSGHVFDTSIDGSTSAAITGSNGGTVTIGLHDAATGELLRQTTRSGDGAFSLSWGDPRPVFTEAIEDATSLGRGATGSLRRVA